MKGALEADAFVNAARIERRSERGWKSESRQIEALIDERLLFAEPRVAIANVERHGVAQNAHGVERDGTDHQQRRTLAHSYSFCP